MVPRLVPLAVVRVDGVAHVRGEADGAGERPGAVLRGAAARVDRTVQDVAEQRALRTGVGLAAGLLVVEGGQHRDVRQPGGAVRGGDGGERGGGRVHREQVVQARAGQQLAVPAEVGGGLDVVRHEVPADHVVGGHPGPLGDVGDQRALVDRAEAPDRGEVALLVELHALVDLAVQVDGELRHAQQRLVQLDEADGAVLEREPAGDAEVAVQPGVQRDTAVDLHRDLPPARRAGVRQRLDAQVGRVGVGTDDPERGLGARALRQVPGDQRAAADQVAPADGAVPGVRLGDLPEARLLQPLRGARDRVVRGRRGAEEGDQIVAVRPVEECLAGGGRHTAPESREDRNRLGSRLRTLSICPYTDRAFGTSRPGRNHGKHRRARWQPGPSV